MENRRYLILSGEIVVAEWENRELRIVNPALLPLFLRRVPDVDKWLEIRAIDSHRANSRLLKKALRLREKDDVSAAYFVNGATVTDNYWIKGKVSKLASGFDPKYGNGTFWISEDGAYNDNLFKDFEVYRTMYLGNKSYVEGDANVAVGDKVVICGQLTNYKGTSETNQNKSYLVSVN